MSAKEEMLFLEIRENVKNVGLAVTVAACFCLLCATLIVLGVGNVWQFAAVHTLGIGVGLIIGRYQVRKDPKFKIEGDTTDDVAPVSLDIPEVKTQPELPEVINTVEPVVAVVQSEPVVTPVAVPPPAPAPEKKITIKKKQKA